MIPNTTPTPNELYNGEMKKMNDTELRVVLMVTRSTLGWVIDKKTGMRKIEDWISSSQLIKKTGRSNKAISTAVKSCIEKKWIEVRDKNGVLLKTAEDRSGKKLFYRLGQIFLSRISSEDSSQVEKPVNITPPTSEDSSLQPVKIVHSTKETLTKEKQQKAEKSAVSNLISFFYKQTEQIRGFKPEVGKKDAGMLKTRLKKYAPDQIEHIILWYLRSKTCDALGATLSTCLSVSTLNKYKEENTKL